MGFSRIRPLTTKELDAITSRPPHTIKHRALGGVPGFVLVHTPAGFTGYALIYRAGGKRRKLTLGSTKALSLADARKLAARHRTHVESGGDPHGEKLEARKQVTQQQERLDAETMWAKYMKLAASQLRSRAEKDRIFRCHILPTVKGVPVTEIKRSHALEVIDRLIAAGKLRMADKARQEGAAWFQWLLEREHVERNPFAGLRKANIGKTIRTRILSDQELRLIWFASEPEGHLSVWIKLLILTGARNAEVRKATWSEFDLEDRVWTIPAARAKNKQDHWVPLSSLTIDVLDRIPRFPDSDFLFPAVRNARNPMSGHQKIKERVDARLRVAMADAGEREPQNWCVHDLRRTVATGLQRLGFRPDIADQVIGHVSGTRMGAAAHYLHHRYEEEKRQALEAWSRHISEILAGTSESRNNVTEIRR